MAQINKNDQPSKIKQASAKIMSQDMDRKEFLMYAAGAAVAMTGVSSLSKNLKIDKSQAANGFGSGAYGGNKTK